MTPAIRLPGSLTVRQFAFLAQCHEETVRRKVRANVIEGRNNPIRIPCRELLKVGVPLDHAAVLLSELHREPQAGVPEPNGESS